MQSQCRFNTLVRCTLISLSITHISSTLLFKQISWRSSTQYRNLHLWCLPTSLVFNTYNFYITCLQYLHLYISIMSTYFHHLLLLSVITRLLLMQSIVCFYILKKSSKVFQIHLPTLLSILLHMYISFKILFFVSSNWTQIHF